MIRIFEGPESTKMRGWRHYTFIDDKHPDSPRCALSRPHGAREFALRSGSEFHPAGTWEPAQKEMAI